MKLKPVKCCPDKSCKCHNKYWDYRDTMSTKKFNFKQMSMSEEMRESVLDEVRKVIDGGNNSVEQTTQLK